MLINSVHPLRLIQLIRLQQKREQNETQPNLNANANYFDCDSATYDKIIKHFPIFDKILSYYKPLADLVKELKLDCKEFALFSAVLAFSTSNFQIYFLFIFNFFNFKLAKVSLVSVKNLIVI